MADHMAVDPSVPHIVIVGAGFGGLEAARGLADAPVRITIVDQRNHHLFQPLLYQVATATLATSEIAWPVRHLVRRQIVYKAGDVDAFVEGIVALHPVRQRRANSEIILERE